MPSLILALFFSLDIYQWWGIRQCFVVLLLLFISGCFEWRCTWRYKNSSSRDQGIEWGAETSESGNHPKGTRHWWVTCTRLTLSTLSKIFSRRHFEIFFLFFPENSFRYFMQIVSKETICMKCQNLFSGKSKKNITNLSSAELAKRVVKVKRLMNGSLKIKPEQKKNS